MKRIATALMWSAVLVAGAWLPGCASEPKGNLNFSEVNENFPKLPIPFFKSKINTDTLSLLDLKGFTAEQLNALTPNELNTMESNTPKDQVLSDAEWTAIITRAETYHPREWFYSQAVHLARRGCTEFESKDSGFLARYVTPAEYRKFPEKFSQINGNRLYETELYGQPSSTLCLYDSPYFDKRQTHMGEYCDIYVATPTVLQFNVATCPKNQSELQPYESPYYEVQLGAAYEGPLAFSGLCRLKARIVDSRARCVKYTKKTQ